MTANKSSAMCFVHGDVCDHINIARSWLLLSSLLYIKLLFVRLTFVHILVTQSIR